MNPRDIITAARDVLASQGMSANLRRLDEMTGKEGIVIRLLPITRTDSHYDLSECLEVPYQIIARYRSDSQAYGMCAKAVELLEHRIFPIEGGSVTDQEIYTYPQELELSESGFYAYETRLTAHVTRH